METNGRFKGVSKLLKPYLPTSADEWNEEGWTQQEEGLLDRMEREFVETLRKSYPERGPAAELRRRYEAGDLTEAEYLAKRKELRGQQRGWG